MPKEPKPMKMGKSKGKGKKKGRKKSGRSMGSVDTGEGRSFTGPPIFKNVSQS